MREWRNIPQIKMLKFAEVRVKNRKQCVFLMKKIKFILLMRNDSQCLGGSDWSSEDRN